MGQYGPLQSGYAGYGGYPSMPNPNLLAAQTQANLSGAPAQSASQAAAQEKEEKSDEEESRSDKKLAASDLPPDNDSNAVAEAGNVLVKMFFLVSLVANCYLIYLIRKLLMRYRSLLSTVRSHAV